MRGQTMGIRWLVLVMAGGLTYSMGACPQDDSGGGDAGFRDSGSSRDSALDGSMRDGGGVWREAGMDASLPPEDPFAPRVFFLDITSGPNRGGEDDLGVFVTIYGLGFGNERGGARVTFGGGEVARYRSWQDDRIVVQLGSDAATGDVLVDVPDKGMSNGIHFVVREGRIFFVGPAGDDGADGSFAHPWRSLGYATRQLQPGDILYGLDGLTQTESDGPGTSLCLSEHYQCERSPGTQQMPIALVAYPGAQVTVGCRESGCPGQAIRIYTNYWTLAGLHVVGSAETYGSAISMQAAGYEEPSEGQRVVGNDVTGGYYGIVIHTTSQAKVLGNHVHDTPHSAIYHGGFGESHDVEIAYNVVHDIGGEGAFGIKAYGHLDSDLLTGLWIHHNLVYNTAYSGILVGGSDGGTPWIRDVRIENNVVYGVVNQWSAGIRIGNSGADETLAQVLILQNTVFDAAYGIDIAVVSTALVQNNLFVAPRTRYLGSDPEGGEILFDHNGYYGGGEIPSLESAPVEGDPRFVDSESGDFRIQEGSAAIDSGADSGVTSDFLGIRRPQGAGFDLGAYEYVLDSRRR